MARKTTTTLHDDLDDSSEDVSPVVFGVDGDTFDIDLSAGNARQLRDLLAPFVAAGRKRKGAAKRPARGPYATGAGDVNPALVRQWALEGGVPIAARGRVPAGVIAAYKANDLDAAHEAARATTAGIAAADERAAGVTVAAPLAPAMQSEPADRGGIEYDRGTGGNPLRYPAQPFGGDGMPEHVQGEQPTAAFSG